MQHDGFPPYIPLSVDSRDILAYVDQPLQARRPVGYQRDFLDAYQPNVSAYLPEPLRRLLHNMGRTAQEYLVIKQELAEPDPMRLAYRAVIKQAVHQVVQRLDADTLGTIGQAMLQVPQTDRDEVQELRRLHEGVLARYGLRPSELSAWKAAQK